jgi:hypothetical protein
LAIRYLFIKIESGKYLAFAWAQTLLAYLADSIAPALANVGQQSQMAGALNFLGQNTLMAGTRASLAPWPDFAVFCYISAQKIDLLVINGNTFIGTELADFRARHETPRPRTLHVLACIILAHSNQLLERKLIFDFIFFDGIVILILGSVTPVSKDHHLVGDDLDRVVFDAFRVFPPASLQASFDINLLALGQVLFANLGKVTPGNDIEPFGLGMALAIRRVPGSAGRHTEGRHRAARRRVTHLRIPSQVANNHYFVEAPTHDLLLVQRYKLGPET